MRQSRRDHASSRPLSGPLGRRLLGWLLLFSLGPLFLSNTLGYVRSQEIITELTERYLQALADIEAQHIRSQVDRYLLDLTTIAAGNEFLSAGALRLSGAAAGPMGPVADKAAVERHLDRKLDELTAFSALYLQRPDGRSLASTGPIPPAALRPVDDKGTGTGLARLSRIEGPGPPRFRLTVDVPSAGGRGTSSYLSALVDQEGLSTFLEIPPHLAGSVESFIVDAEGRPLFVSHPHHPVDYETPLPAAALDSASGTFARYYNLEERDVIGVAVPVPGVSWRYLAEAPVEAALGPLQLLRRTSLFVELGMAALLVLGAWFVVRGIVGPVGHLVDASRTVAAGDLSVRLQSRRSDEIGELGRAFDEMTSALERARNEVDALHNRELERAGQLATVGELASGVAHEIKNPLVGISNGLDLVRRKVEDDGTLDPIMDEMGRQLRRIEAAVRDLLAFARPAKPTLQPCDPNRVAERAVRLVQPAAERSGVTVEFRAGDDVPLTEMDGELVGQAVVNLLMNAVHATPEGGVVTARTGRSDEAVEIVVQDPGRGIPPGELESVFKPFYTTRHNGTGLGLSITRDIVERHRGRVEVESAVGEGSSFTLVLPTDGGRARVESGARADTDEVDRRRGGPGS